MKKFGTVALSIMMALALTACSGGGETSSGETETTNKTQVWSTYSTAKVMFSKELNGNYENLGKKLDVKMAKGEKEMAQIVITSDKQANYDIKLNDLLCGDKVFKKENIEVFHQKPINIVSKTTGNYNEMFPKGLTPDCLLPFETAKAYGENQVLENSNQPVSFEFTTTEDVVAGTYTGSFDVIVGNETFNLPVTLTVWDYVLPRGTYGKSCMLIYQSELFYGELDSSDEMYARYFEELLSHKMNAWHVPCTATSPEKMVDNVIKYWDYENFNCFGMPDLTINNEINYEEQRKYLLELGRRSTEDRILFDKAYFYHTVVDEPHSFPEKKAKVPRIISEVNELLKDIIAQLESEGMFSGKPEFKSAMEKSIMAMPQIITSPYFSDFDGSNLTYCPPIQYIDPADARKDLKKHAEDNNVSTWTYTCNNPTHPFPSTHIDDHLIGSRIMKWMQKSYDVEGYLAWSVAHYSKVVPFTHTHEKINPYVDPQRVLGPGAVANGDGYLFYPGKKYGSEFPFTSIRMKSLRDGQDDYDSLSLLSEKYNELDSFYNAGGTINSDEILQPVYDNLFSGTIYNNSDRDFLVAREKVADMIVNSALDEKFVCSSEVKGKTLALNLYANSGYNVTLNGEKLSGTPSGKGNKFTKNISLENFDGTLKVKVTKDGYSKDYDCSMKKISSLTDFEKGSGSEQFDVMKHNTINIAGGKAEITVNSVDRGNDSANMRYSTGFTLKTSGFNGGLLNVGKIYFDVENKFNEMVNMTVYVVSDGAREEFMQIQLAPNEVTRVSMNRVYAFEPSKLSKADGIFFAFENARRKDDSVVLYEPRNLSLSDIYYIEK